MPLDFALSLMVYELLILATCPHSFEAISALASSLRLKKIRVWSVYSNVHHASELPSTERSELMDWVATMGIHAALPGEGKRLLVAARIVFADAGERLIFVADKDGRPDVAAGLALDRRRPAQQRLEPRIFEHDADRA